MQVKQMLDCLETTMRFAFMKACSLAALLLSTSSASAGIDFWNSNLTWAGQGQCSAEFTFDSGFEDIQSLEIHFNLVDKTGKVIATDSMALDAFGQSSADRYQQTFVESEEICDDTLRLVVTRAIAKIDGKLVDLVKTRGISARDFKPITIRVPKP